MYKQNIFKLLKLLRGDYTQKEMAINLGIKSNAYYKWEAGYKNILLREFVEILNFLNIDFYQLIKDSFLINQIGNLQNDTILIIEKHFPYDLTTFLNETGFSDSKWWRLKNQKKDILLVDFFKVLDIRSKLLYRFYHQLNFKNYHAIDSTLASSEKIKRFRHYLNKLHYFAHFTATIYLSEVREAPSEEEKIKKISTKLQIETSEITKLIKKLIKDEILIKKNDQYEFIVFENTIPSQMRNMGVHLYEHIYKESFPKLSSSENKARFFYRVAPISEEALLKIHDIQNKMSKEIYQIILEDSPDKRNQIFSFIHSSTSL